MADEELIGMLAGLVRRLFDRQIRPSGRQYWEERARQRGAHAVLRKTHGGEDFDEITRAQREAVFPLLRGLLTGREKRIVDLGCGTGRFTSGLANLIEGKGIGLEPTAELLRMAEQEPNVLYVHMDEGVLPLRSASVEIVWVYLVLGGILNRMLLLRTLREIGRVLEPGGLLFLVENTSDRPNRSHWKFRSVRDYQRLADGAGLRLEHLGDHFDLNDRLSVLAGRKRASGQA